MRVRTIGTLRFSGSWKKNFGGRMAALLIGHPGATWRLTVGEQAGILTIEAPGR